MVDSAVPSSPILFPQASLCRLHPTVEWWTAPPMTLGGKGAVREWGMRGYDFFFSFHLILHPITYSVFTHLLLDLGQGGFWSLSLFSLLQIRTTSWPYISYSTHNHSAVNEGVEQSGDSRLKTMPAKRLHSSVPQPWCLKKGLPGTWTQMSCRYMVWQCELPTQSSGICS